MFLDKTAFLILTQFPKEPEDTDITESGNIISYRLTHP